MTDRCGRQAFAVQLADLLLVQLANWRWGWRSMVVLGMAAPLLSITMLGILIRDSGVVALEYVLVGNVVLALMFENQNKVSSNFAYMRARGTLRFVATLPVYKSALILATVVAFLLLALPAVVVTIAAGSRILGVELAPSPWVLLVVPLCAIPLASLGALVGSIARTPEEAGSVSLLLTLLLLSLGPVLVPPERLPEALNLAGYASPATYAASALRQVLLGPVNGRLALDLGVLAGLSMVVLWFVERRLRWRVG